jgi:hypothetical protein
VNAADRLTAEQLCTVYRVDPTVIVALIDVESDGNPYAWNPEPKYRYFWNVKTRAPFRKLTAEESANETPPKDFPCLAGDSDQEWWAQQASWGLMQVMGAVAREAGYQGPYLTRLCDPYLNLEFGIRHFKSQLDWAKGDTRAALAAYNGGRAGNSPGKPLRNAGYADKVLSRRKVA